MSKSDTSQGDFALKPAHLTAIELINGGKTITESAALVGINRQYLSRLVHENPVFKAELERRRYEGLQELRSLLRDCTVQAANEAMALFHDKDVPPAVRLQTAVSLLNKLIPFYSGDCREPRTDEQLAGEMAETAAMSGMDLFSDPERKERLLLSAREELE